jgi:phospholipase C
MALNYIEQIVMAMLENRSFDNLLGWLNDNQANPPKFNISAQPSPTLKPNTYSNALNGNQFFASHPPTGWPPANNPNLVPTPDAP